MTDENKRLAEAMARFIDCPCEYFPPASDASDVLAAFEEARIDGLEKGYTPVLAAVDEVLFETLLANTDESALDSDPFSFDLESVRAARRELLEVDLDEDAEDLAAVKGELEERTELDSIEAPDFADGIGAVYSEDGESTLPMLLAKIPTTNPWEVFAYLPFGQFNNCPDARMMMAAARGWYELHGAVPAVVAASELEMIAPAPLAEADAFDAALELAVICPDVVEESYGSVAALAAILEKNSTWYFWWR